MRVAQLFLSSASGAYEPSESHLKGLQEQGLAMKFEEARKKRERVAELPDPIRNYVGGVEPGEL